MPRYGLRLQGMANPMEPMNSFFFQEGAKSCMCGVSS